MNTDKIEIEDPFMQLVADRWWVLVVRGVAALLFAIMMWYVPQVGLTALVFTWGAYAIIDGFLNFGFAVRSGRAGGSWGWFVFEGIVSVLAGVFTFLSPAITAVMLLFVIAAWAVVTGVAEIAAAIRLRAVLRHEWLLALAGASSIVFGALLFARPAEGALAVAWLIGGYALLFGVLLIALGVKVHRWAGASSDLSTGGTPRPA
jgi:uncharacterized membrane protein HdeD (DUF308 family)